MNDEPEGKTIKQVVNENVNISEDVELKKLFEKDRELQKEIEEIDKKRVKEFEELQKEITSLLEDSD